MIYEDMANKIKNRIMSIALFICCFTIIITFCGVIFGNAEYGIIPVCMLFFMSIVIVILLAIRHLFNKFEKFFEKHWGVIVFSGIMLMLIINIVNGFKLRYQPVYDLGAIYTGAIEWTENGTFANNINKTCDPYYFYYFPNNLGGVTFLHIGFEIASIFGVHDYYAVAMVMNAIIIAVTMLLIILIAKRLAGKKLSLMVMVSFMMMLPFYHMAAAFYTDSLSLMFPVFVIYMYLKFLDEDRRWVRWLYAALMSSVCAIGMLIKFTVLIALIAVLIHHFLQKKIVSAIKLIAGAGIIISLTFAVFNGYIYSNHLDKSIADEYNTPYAHWIMMSIEGNGRYKVSSYEFTRSYKDPKERKEAIYNRIGELIKEKEIGGMLDLFYLKGIISFGDGTLALSDFLDDNPQNLDDIHSYVLYSGKNYNSYSCVCSAVYFSYILLVAVYACIILGNKEKRNAAFLPISILGIILFLYLWEVNGRYATNYVPVIVLTAVFGLEYVYEYVMKRINIYKLNRK